MSGFVYAIGAEAGPVKIGFSANPRIRLNKINSDTSEACRLLGCVKATKLQEQELHVLLQASRLKGEWFRRDAAVMALLAMLPAPELKRRPMSSGHALALYRHENSLTMAAFAEKIGSTKATVCRLERGQSVPSFAMLLRIRQATGGTVSAEHFMPAELGAIQ